MSVKEILDNLNISNYINIENFFETMLNKNGETISYVSLKEKFINYFSKHSNFNEKLFEKIIKEIKINSNKEVNLIEFLIRIYNIRNKEIISPLLIFYFLSYQLNTKYPNYTTSEYITRNSISLDDAAYIILLSFGSNNIKKFLIGFIPFLKKTKVKIIVKQIITNITQHP